MTLLHLILAWLFWLCFAGVAYSYLVYPIILILSVRLFGRKEHPDFLRDDALPAVTLLIAAHNEEPVIEGRIRNALAMDYPPDKLQILIASDASTDRTNDIVRSFADKGARLLDYQNRSGKTAMLNSAFGEVRTPMVMLSDANTFTEPNAARCLMRWFVNPRIGVVSGRLILTDPVSGKNVDSMYWRYETFLKKRESQLGALLGSNGAIYAIRTELFRPIPGNTIVDDFVIPLAAKLRSGCDVIYDPDAVANEESAPDVKAEFKRRSRIGAGGWQAIGQLWRLLNPANGWIAFTFFSHKVLRWLCPFFLIGMLVANVPLAFDSVGYRLLLAGQLLGYALAVAGAFVPTSVPVSRFFRLANMFVAMNAALLVGFFRWLLSSQSGIWSRTQRMS